MPKAKARKTGERTFRGRIEKRDDEDRKMPVYRGKRPANATNKGSSRAKGR